MQVGFAQRALGLKQQKPQSRARLGSLDADLGFRLSVMSAAGILRQGSAGRPLQEVGYQVAERPPLLISAVLQSLRRAPQGWENEVMSSMTDWTGHEVGR